MELYSAVLTADPDTPVLFRVSATDEIDDAVSTDEDVCDLFDCDHLVDTCFVRSLGAGLSSSTVNVSFDPP